MHLLGQTRPKDDGFLVLDYGSQYTLLITRRLRERGVYSEVIPGTSEKPPAGFNFHGIILSGGPDSVGDEGARTLPKWVLESGKPILGICYGMQLLVKAFGGVVRSGKGREYGKAELILDGEMRPSAAKVFYNMPTSQTVWMSHGDDLAQMPNDFTTVARTSSGVVAAIVHDTKPIIGLQFHPEVNHTECGLELLSKFISEVSNAPVNWDPDNMLDASIKYAKETVGDGHALVACSGGVDSSVVAALLIKALGPNKVTAVFCDHGLLRKNEVSWVAENLKHIGLKKIEVLNKKERFFKDLKGVRDPEQKRKLIGVAFIEEFEKYATKQEGFTHLGQGTIYPDVIESAGHGSGAKVIKSHHNVGGLPEKLKLPLVEPLRYLFKDEVRVLGKKLGLPDFLVDRHPFPGPGLAIRILSDVNEEDVSTLQEADDIFIKALREHNLYHEVWQAFAVLLPTRSVGVMGDDRTYEKTIALRTVTSTDAMTAGVGHLPMEFLTKVAGDIVQGVKGVNRVVYDITTKPPATIEWE